MGDVSGQADFLRNLVLGVLPRATRRFQASPASPIQGAANIGLGEVVALEQ
jgi:hypothetical protein